MPLIIQVHSYFTFGFSLLFLFQTFSNISIYRQGILDKKFLLAHIALCGFSSLYAFVSFLMVLPIHVDIKFFLLHIMWISGSLISASYIHSLKSFLNDKSDNLKIVGKLPLLSAGLALVALIVWQVTGTALFVDSAAPTRIYENYYMMQIGGFNAGGFVKFLSLLVFLPTLYSSVYFLRMIFRSGFSNSLLVFGICLTFLAFFNDLIISFADPTYFVPLMFLANVLEITRITKANQNELGSRLESMKENLIQTSKLSDAGSFYASLAHEILTPMQAAKGYLYLFNKTDSKEHLESMEKQLDKIERLAKNVKKYTKVSTSTETSPVGLDLILKDSLETVQVVAYHAAVKISPLCESVKIQVLCIQDQLVQVITNLLINSIEAVNSHSEKWVEINCRFDSSAGKVFIMVRDSGKGIPEDLHEKIWEERFTTKPDTGLGLGLSICRKIMDKQKGKLSLNAFSKNTEFVLELPAIQVQ